VTALMLTPELQEAICRHLMYGVEVPVACGIEGISKSTYYGWRKRGENGEEPYASFLVATEQAMDKLEKAVTGTIIQQASKGNWQAGAWWLRFRKNGGRQQLELTGPGGSPLGAGTLTPEAAEEIRRKILFGERALPADAGDDEGGDAR
jgi:hypothetical protein